MTENDYLKLMVYGDGTVCVLEGSTSVIGSQTEWAHLLAAGGMFSCLGIGIPIKSVEDDTHLTLAYAWPSCGVSEEAYANGLVINRANRSLIHAARTASEVSRAMA